MSCGNTGPPMLHGWRRIAAAGLMILLPILVWPDTPAMPESYKHMVGANDEFVFVMLASGGYANGAGEAYPASGLYRNDGSVDPMWTVDGYSFGVLVSDDGRYLVRWGPWAGSVEQVAVAFYDRGELLRSYAIRELVRDETKLHYTVSHFFWVAGSDFDPRDNLLKVSTASDDTYLFDVSTGAIILALHSPTPPAARVERDGVKAERLRNLRVCWSDTVLIGRGSSDKAGGAPLVDAIGLGSIHRMVRVAQAGKHPVTFRIFLREGEEKDLSFPKPAPSLCGVSADGSVVMIPMAMLNSLSVEPGAVTP